LRVARGEWSQGRRANGSRKANIVNRDMKERGEVGKRRAEVEEGKDWSKGQNASNVRNRTRTKARSDGDIVDVSAYKIKHDDNVQKGRKGRGGVEKTIVADSKRIACLNSTIQFVKKTKY
jgi:hypothetical protein